VQLAGVDAHWGGPLTPLEHSLRARLGGLALCIFLAVVE
jgi:hypothetical protein